MGRLKKKSGFRKKKKRLKKNLQEGRFEDDMQKPIQKPIQKPNKRFEALTQKQPGWCGQLVPLVLHKQGKANASAVVGGGGVRF